MNKNHVNWLQYRYPLIALVLTVLLLFLHSNFSVKPSSASNAQPEQITITKSGFLPSHLTISKGQISNLKIINSDTDPHNFVIPGLHIGTPPLSAGQSTTLSVPADKEGTYPFESNAPGYPEIGLRGTLTIK